MCLVLIHIRSYIVIFLRLWEGVVESYYELFGELIISVNLY